ncbi:winged helix-turn-helix domain-containing protein [Nocardia cyriacigeorgica]|uniref:AfsR/SARP family transcriptional regulator n=1 Tax=Nocardia cyriacigeorgica TaxID=135487 RepID=UPI001896110D|nr:AfsR/SARP family transcriptional regulator [Nocardia cyriacigeorgica]MBF6395665.1 winged helix-turn-helix domain-containing protein [Nocardia cyriacigeorgica]MBF6401297.1 winged helix-turn-helix domain-containing protein [Nocardia cyriacigeorgica]
MLFSILGPVDLRVEDKPIDLGPAKQRAILSALLIDRDRPVPLEVLVDRVWGDTPPADVRNLVYTYIARLRRKLASVCSDEAGDPALKRVVGGYCLQTPPETVDLYVFRHLLERSRQPGGTDAERSALLTQANSMWRGIPLSGIGGRWASAMRHSLQQLRHEALVEWADVEVRLGRPRMVIDPLRQAYVESPLSESIATQLMLALHNDGRSSEALQLFDKVRRHLSTEIGADPGPALREAHTTILQGHATAQPALAPVPVVPAEPVDTAPESGPPDMLPIDLPDFTGRDDHVRLVRDTLTPGAGPLIPSVVVLYGPAGFGKTTIAVHAAYQLRSHFPSGRLYVDLEGNGGSPADPHDVLERLLRALGVPKDEIPERFTERAEMYRGRLARSRTLVVLDNAVDEPQVAPLLPGTGHCGVIVTCRVRPVVPQGVPVIRVDAMPAGESMALLRRLAGDRVDREPEAARELLELCGGSPLLLRVVGNRLMIRPNWSLGRLLTRLRDDDRLLAELTDGRHDVRARIAESYLTIGPATQRFFVELAARPATRWSARTAARALDLSETEAEEHLEQLLDVHLVDAAPGAEPGADIYLLPKLHRLFARSVSAHVRTLPVANLGVVGF